MLFVLGILSNSNAYVVEIVVMERSHHRVASSKMNVAKVGILENAP